MKLLIYLLSLNVLLIFASEVTIQKSNQTDIKNPFVSALNAFSSKNQKDNFDVRKNAHKNDDLYLMVNDDRLRTDVSSDTVEFNKKKQQRSVKNTYGNYFRDIISKQNANQNEKKQQSYDSSDRGDFFFNAQRLRTTQPSHKQNYGSEGYPPTREIVVKQGRLYGVVRQLPIRSGLRSVDQFLGIPYAESPTGSR
jgi:hypothetical protein